MGDLLTFDELLDIDDEEVDNLLEEYKRTRQERANQQFQSFKVLPPYPQLVIDCIEYLRLNYGYLKEGIFRVNGDSKAVNRIRHAYEIGLEDPLSEASSIDTFDVATALKSYFRLLDEPLIPDENYERMKDIAESGEELSEQVEKLSVEIGRLPSPNLEVLSYLMLFFKEVVAEEESNRMTPKNMGTCLTMSVTRFDPDVSPGASSMAAMVEIGLSTKILSLMISDVDFRAFLSKEQQDDMRRRSCYRPKSISKPPKRVNNNNSKNKPLLPPLAAATANAATTPANAAITPTNNAAAQEKPKVPPRVPPRAQRGKPSSNSLSQKAFEV